MDAPPKRYTHFSLSWVFWVDWDENRTPKNLEAHDVLRVNQQQVITGICLFLILIPLLLMTYNTFVLIILIYLCTYIDTYILYCLDIYYSDNPSFLAIRTSLRSFCLAPLFPARLGRFGMRVKKQRRDAATYGALTSRS